MLGLRRLPRHRRAPPAGSWRARPTRRTSRGTDASCCRSAPYNARRHPGPIPGHAPASLRIRLDKGPTASLKLASGCDRRCTFCAIPSFRGSFVSRRPTEVLDEARWLAAEGSGGVPGQRELDVLRQRPRRLATPRDPATRARRDRRRRPRTCLLPAASRDPARPDRGDRDHAGCRLLFRPLVPACYRAGLAPDASVRRCRAVPGIAGGDASAGPFAGARSNFIVGFPGETEDDLEILADFLVAARLDAIGVFGYSDEDGTEAAGLDAAPRSDEIRARVDHVSRLVEQLTSQRAEDRVGERVDVLGSRTARARGPRPPTRAPRSTVRPPSRPPGMSRRGWSCHVVPATGSTWSAPPVSI